MSEVIADANAQRNALIVDSIRPTTTNAPRSRLVGADTSSTQTCCYTIHCRSSDRAVLEWRRIARDNAEDSTDDANKVDHDSDDDENADNDDSTVSPPQRQRRSAVARPTTFVVLTSAPLTSSATKLEALVCVEYVSHSTKRVGDVAAVMFEHEIVVRVERSLSVERLSLFRFAWLTNPVSYLKYIYIFLGEFICCLI
jgi:hypothetical protein